MHNIFQDIWADIDGEHSKLPEQTTKEGMYYLLAQLGTAFDLPEQYAILRYYIYRLTEIGRPFSHSDACEIADRVLANLERLMPDIKMFYWYPKILLDVDRDGFHILEMIIEPETKDLGVADQLLDKIKSVKGTLESEDYTYRRKEDIMKSYNLTVSECEKEVAYLKGDKTSISNRSKAFIEGEKSNE